MDWRALADHVRSGRAQRGWTQTDLAAAAGVSLKTISDIEAGIRKRLPNKMAHVEAALEWTPGTARRLLEGAPSPSSPAGGDPPPVEPEWPGELEFWRSTAQLPPSERENQLLEWRAWQYSRHDRRQLRARQH